MDLNLKQSLNLPQQADNEDYNKFLSFDKNHEQL